MKPKTIILATHNAHKLSEMQRILGTRATVMGLDALQCTEDVPETSETIAGNARQKAQWVARRYGVRCVADDTGLEVDALDGEPGVLSARYAQTNGCGDSHDAQANMQLLLQRLDGVPYQQRTARFRTVIAVASPQGEDAVFEGVVEGHITDRPHGNGGFGYDPVFFADELGMTFAQADGDAKNAVSHRGRATRALMAYLASDANNGNSATNK